jgi:hypothetical protein
MHASCQSIRTKFRVLDLISQWWELFFPKKSIIIDDFLGVLVVSQLRNFERRGNKEEVVINLTNGWSAVVNQSKLSPPPHQHHHFFQKFPWFFSFLGFTLFQMLANCCKPWKWTLKYKLATWPPLRYVCLYVFMCISMCLEALVYSHIIVFIRDSEEELIWDYWIWRSEIYTSCSFHDLVSLIIYGQATSMCMWKCLWMDFP